MMNDRIDIDAVLEELYVIEPDLRTHGPALRKLAIELLAARPDARIDEAFVERLRRELVARGSVPRTNPLIAFFTMTDTKFLAPGLAILAIAAVGTIAFTQLQSPSGSPSVARVSYAPSFERVGSSAFGPLAGATVGARPESGGGGMGLGASAPSVSALPQGSGGDAAKLTAPGDWTPTFYKHVYKGEAIEGLSADVDVYRRVRGGAGSGPVTALLGFHLGLMDLGRARNAGIQSFTLAEDRENGYVINVNPEEGTINIYENYLKWNYPERACTDEACFDAYRLKESDMMTDAEAIRTADAFLAAYDVSKDGYGAPVVRSEWREHYLRATDKASFWFPDVVTVVYPQLIDGRAVYDEGGVPYGLNVNVNVRHKRSVGLWNLSTRNFQVSAYAGETDAARLIGIAERGGLSGDVYVPENAKVVEVELGTPTVSYVRMWQWNGGAGSELLVPTLIFPVLNVPADYWRSNVTVPLAKELLTAPDVSIMPVPLEKAVQ